MEMSNQKQFTALAEDNGKRLDKFLTDKLEKISRSQIKKLIEKGNVLVNASIPSVHEFLHEGDLISVMPTKKDADLKTPEIDIILQGDGFIVIDKRAGILTHPANHQKGGTVLDWLLEHDPDISEIGDPARPGIVHRLDRDTSGVMILATTLKMYDHLREQFHDRKVSKTYVALVHDQLPHLEGTINKPIGRSEKGIRMAARVEKVSEKDREAITNYKVMQTFQKYSLVEAKPLTGRTHQIRVHLMSLGNPVVGDQLYKVHGQKKVIDLGRIFLHATQIKFTDLSGHEVVVDSPLPKELENFLLELK